MKTFLIILISVLISLLILVGAIIYVINYVPFGALDFLTFNKPQNVFGTTLTDLQSTDTMSNFPTLYNANNSALNAGKIENSSSSIAAITTLSNLSSIGTITTGIWNATAIVVSKGGTGTTSPSQYLVILGNGSAGLTVASSTGTTGQFLTSNGANAYPSWQTSSVTLSDEYAWTGTHTWSNGMVGTGSTTLAASSLTTSYLKLNGLAYAFPPANNASSSVLMNNGSGSLSWNPIDWQLLGEQVLTADAASMSVTILAKTELNVNIFIASSTANNVHHMRFNADSGANYDITKLTWNQQSATELYNFDPGETDFNFNLALASSTSWTFNIVNRLNSPKIARWEGVAATPGHFLTMTKGAGVWNNTTAQITTITITPSTGEFRAGSWLSVYGRR